MPTLCYGGRQSVNLLSMKYPFPFLSIFLAICLGSILSLQAQAPKARDEDPEFVNARQLFWSGQYSEAEKAFNLYLASNPDHRPSQNFLKMIVQAKRYDPTKIGPTKDRLASIRIDKVQFKNADWPTLITYFQDIANPQKSTAASKTYIHFINLLPSQFSAKVTLDLKNVSLLQAIEKACQQTGLRYVIDTWAVFIDLPEGGK